MRNIVSIVILNWNGKDFLQQFLPILLKYSELPGAEVIVADNGSTDDSLAFMDKEFSGVEVLRLEKNYGFSGGYNRALEQLDSRYYLLLNSDVEVTEGWLEPLLEEMELHPEAAACSPKIKDFHRRSHFEYAGAGGGYLDRYGYAFCRGRIFDHLEEDHGQYDDPVEVFWGTGACLLVRADIYGEAGGLDELFFAHMEEIDLCWRMKRMGYTVRYVPGSTVYHVGGGTLQRGNPRKTFLNFRNNLLLLYKNLSGGERRKVLFWRKVLDAISAFRFQMQGAFGDFRAVLRAHGAYYGMKSSYRGTGSRNIPEKNSVIVTGIYPGSIVAEFFLRGRKQFDQLRHWRRGSG
ncbi:MAG: glycosyltransferase family 2 protein [Bacteroidales bacterium]